jgi:hypothetical protein
MAIKFVRSVNGGMVPSDHPDADPNSAEVDPSKTTASGETTAIGAAPPPPGAPGTPPAPPPGQPLAPASTTPVTPGTPTTIQDAYRQSMMTLLNGPTPEQAAANVNQSAPVAAYRNEQLRGFDQARAGAAEQSGLTGMQGSGGFEGNVQALRQAAGENTATYAGEQANTLMAGRRAEILQGLQMAQASGQFDQSQALQKQLADLDASLRNRGFDIQQALGQESNANQRYATEVQKLLGMSDTDLRRYLGEMQNATSRYGIDVGAGTAADRLGFDYTDLNQRSYQDWLNSQQKGGA